MNARTLPVWRRITFLLLLVCINFVQLQAQVCPAFTTLYVDSSIAVSGNGNGWGTAIKEMRDAFKIAQNCANITTIYIAKGTYKPTNDANRDSAFAITRGGLKIYGGYASGGATRNIATYPTILSGDIGTINISTDNSYHVIVFAGLTNTADSLVFDGFSITNGNANGAATKLYNGQTIVQTEGGGFNLFNNGLDQKLAIRNCILTTNNAGDGGGFSITYSAPTIANCTLLANTANNGAGIKNSSASPTITNTSFLQNIAYGSGDMVGGGMCNAYSNPLIYNSLFKGNTALRGGAVGNIVSSPNFYNCVIINNNAQTFGNVAFNTTYASPNFINCTITGNTGSQAFYMGAASHVTISNSIAYNNGSFSKIDDVGYSTINFINGINGIDPLFANAADADGADNIFGTADDGLVLLAGSPAVNIGDNGNVPSILLKDFKNNARIQNAFVDAGAYESNFTGCNPAVGTTIYVDSSIAVSGLGNSWSTAFRELRDAINAAAQCTGINTIYVAKGTYKPTDDANQDSAFTILRGGLKFYGGYGSGGGTRNVATNETIISGDIGTANDNSDNSYHVIMVAGLTNVADSLVIDGFKVTDANADGGGGKTYNGAFTYENEGGGIYFHSNNGAGGKISVRNCTFSNNNASAYGGGFYNQMTSPTVVNCTFIGNTAENGAGVFTYNASAPAITNGTFTGNIANSNGGGIYNLGTSLTLINCTFTNNKAAAYGGGISNQDGASPIINKSIFSGNTANVSGGGISNWNSSSPIITNTVFSGNSSAWAGAIYNFTSSSPVLTNCVFTGNSGPYHAGAIMNQYFCSPIITNCTFTLNSSTVAGGIMNYISSAPIITNSIFWGNTGSPAIGNNGSSPVVTYSLVQDGFDGIGNVSTDPLFINANDADGADNIFGTADDGLKPQIGSQAINTGNNNAIPAGTLTDIVGIARISRSKVDMGAYEDNIPTNARWYVDSSVATSGGGLSWNTAVRSFATALNIADNGDTIFVAKGTYQPEQNTSFVMKENVKLYGGFNGTESNIAQRILPNIGGSNAILKGNGSQVINNTVNGLTNASVLEGFTITGGSGVTQGGGMYNNSVSPIIKNCTFLNNTVNGTQGQSIYGGGLFNNNSLPVITNCLFQGNMASDAGAGYGGGMANLSSSVKVTNCVFIGNMAGASSFNGGGGMHNIASSPQITNCVFYNNKVMNGIVGYGGAIGNGSSSPIIKGCTIVGNSATATGAGNISNGGGIMVDGGVVISNSIIWDNNTNISSNTANVTYNVIQGGFTGDGNTASDPLFANEANPAGADGIFGTVDDGLKLSACSPAINIGRNDSIPTGINTDFANTTRIVNATVDMGAYEYISGNNPAFGSLLAINGDSNTIAISVPTATNPVTASALACRMIATVLPQGASPVTGNVTAQVWVDATVQTQNSLPYVQRHYELLPAINALTATARITLYYSQAEFDAYNTAAKKIGLPTAATDNVNKASLRIYQYHGASSDGSGKPSSYTGTTTTIDPTDTDIFWNTTLTRWEISFDVTGFSGFFVGSIQSNILPVQLISFDGVLNANNKVVNLKWQVAEQVSIKQYVVERSVDGNNFKSIGTVAANSFASFGYNYMDVVNTIASTLVYYRLQIIDADGSITYSKIVTIKLPQQDNLITIYPIPAKDFVWITGGNAALIGTAISLTNMQGQTLQLTKIIALPQRINLTGFEAGVYFLRLNDGQVFKIMIEY